MKGSLEEYMKIIRKNHKTIFIFIFFLLIFIIFYIKINLDKNKYQNIIIDDEIKKNKTENNNDNETCMIDIKGAVVNPGVYSTKCSDNVSDVIRLAGGLTDNADTSVTNLAKQVSNEMVIIIYTQEEVNNSNIVDTVIKVVEQECVCPNIQNDGCINDKIDDTISNKNLKVNINTAKVEELEKIPGIGEAKAKSIIDYRNKFGNFKSIDDIQNVEGIGSKLYESIKIYLTT